MLHEKCPNGEQHSWLCKTQSGLAGEKSNLKKLSDTQVSTVISDSSKSEEVCPGGIIICGNCDATLVEGATLPDLTNEFIQGLEGKVVE